MRPPCDKISRSGGSASDHRPGACSTGPALGLILTQACQASKRKRPGRLVFTTVPRYTARCCHRAPPRPRRATSSRAPAAGKSDREEERVSSVVKKRKKKMRKHKHRKMLKKTRWQRKHKG